MAPGKNEFDNCDLEHGDERCGSVLHRGGSYLEEQFIIQDDEPAWRLRFLSEGDEGGGS